MSIRSGGCVILSEAKDLRRDEAFGRDGPEILRFAQDDTRFAQDDANVQRASKLRSTQ